MLRYQTIKDKAYRVLDLTSLSLDEFEQMVEPFETAFVQHMQQWTAHARRPAALHPFVSQGRTPSGGPRCSV